MMFAELVASLQQEGKTASPYLQELYQRSAPPSLIVENITLT